MDRDFSIGERKFKLNKISAMKQFHIVRRIAPILADLLPSMKDITKTKNDSQMSEDQKLDKLAQLASPLMTGLSKLSDADANLVLIGLLASVEMQQSTGNWARIANDNQIMFEDLELPILLNAAGRAFMFNMASFFAILPQVS